MLSLFFSPFILPTLRCGRCIQLQLTPIKAKGFFMRTAGLAFYSNLFTRKSTVKPTNCAMDEEKLLALSRNQASEQICLVSSFSTELLEMHSDDPRLHFVFIPGNPGVVSFYKDFVETVYEKLDGNVSITAIGHIGHTRKDWERGKMFSLQDQIDHKFSEEPDLSFMKKKQDQIALLYGIDDHWGPLSVFEEISWKAPGIALSLEEEGHTHAFCCTNAGSVWVARHVANLIRSRIPY